MAGLESRMTWREWRVVILASLGGALEYYDFIVYGIFAKYIAGAFFPAQDALGSLMLAFAVFGVGYLARPLGGVILAHFGDRYGRRRVFITSILAMSSATVLMGLLPTYAQWGPAATALMVLLRLTQGFCVGGELPAATTYVAETAPRKAGLACGAVFVCINTGVALASLLSLILHQTASETSVASWGWRVAFLLGGVMGLGSFLLRLTLEETAEFSHMRSHAAKRPLGEILRDFRGPIIVGVAVTTSVAAWNGLLFGHLPAYLTTVLHYSGLESIQAQNLCLLVISFGNLFWAWLGDRIPRRLIMLTGAALVTLLSYPFYKAAADRSINLMVLVAIAGAVGSMFTGTFAAILADLFPTRVRFSGVALSMNIGLSVVSGAAPLTATWLVSATGQSTAPAYFMIVAAFIAVIGALFLKRYDGRILADSAVLATDGAPS